MDKAIYRELLDMAAERDIQVIENETMKKFKSEGLYIANHEVTIIFIEKSLDDLAHRNFILAHELGHHDMHYTKGISQENRCIEQIEEEANLYAYRLLGQLIEDIGQCCQVEVMEEVAI